MSGIVEADKKQRTGEKEVEKEELKELKLFGYIKGITRSEKEMVDNSIKPNRLYILCNPLAPKATQELIKGIGGQKFNSKTTEYIIKIIKKEEGTSAVPELTQNFWQLWARASNTLQDDEAFDGEHLCDPVMSGDFFETDKLKETINFIFLVANNDKKVLTFMTVRDLSSIDEFLKTRTTEPRTGDMMELKKKYEEKREGKNYLYIDGICSKERGVAMNLLKFLQNICCNSDYYKGIKLAAITYVIKLYAKYKFKFDTGNDNYNKNLNDTVSKLENIREDDAIFKDERWFDFINTIQAIPGITTTETPISKKQLDRMKRYLSMREGVEPSEKAKKKEATPEYQNRLKKAYESHDVLVNGFNMKWDKPTEGQSCVMQGGGKNSKKRTKKKAPRRRKKRRRRRTKKRSCKKRMTKKTICLKGINKKAMRKLVKVTKKLGKMKGIKMTRCSKRRIKKWTKKKRRR